MKDIKGHQSNYILVLMMVAFFFMGCRSRSKLYPPDYLKWMNDAGNGLDVKKEINGMIYELRYITPEGMALNELRKTNPGKSEFEKTRKGYGDMSYFKLRMYTKNGEHIHDYLKKEGQQPYGIESYLNYDAQKDWIMVTKGDTVKCGLFEFSKTYGVSMEFDMEMAFPYADTLSANDLTVEWNDNATGNGDLKFLFKSRDLQRIPQIRF